MKLRQIIGWMVVGARGSSRVYLVSSVFTEASHRQADAFVFRSAARAQRHASSLRETEGHTGTALGDMWRHAKVVRLVARLHFTAADIERLLELVRDEERKFVPGMVGSLGLPELEAKLDELLVDLMGHQAERERPGAYVPGKGEGSR